MIESASAIPATRRRPSRSSSRPRPSAGRTAPSHEGRVGAIVGQMRARRGIFVIIAVNGLRPRVQQQPGLIGPQPLLRIPRPVNPITVALPRTDPRHVDVPHVAGACRSAETESRCHHRRTGTADAALARAERVHREFVPSASGVEPIGVGWPGRTSVGEGPPTVVTAESW